LPASVLTAERYETGKVWFISSGRPGGIHDTLILWRAYSALFICHYASPGSDSYH